MPLTTTIQYNNNPRLNLGIKLGLCMNSKINSKYSLSMESSLNQNFFKIVDYRLYNNQTLKLVNSYIDFSLGIERKF
jgi:hypothetical protein